MRSVTVNSWLLKGLREAKAEALANPRLQEKVDANPSGFIQSKPATLDSPGPEREAELRAAGLLP